jgi:hypothetical protein
MSSGGFELVIEWYVVDFNEFGIHISPKQELLSWGLFDLWVLVKDAQPGQSWRWISQISKR